MKWKNSNWTLNDFNWTWKDLKILIENERIWLEMEAIEILYLKWQYFNWKRHILIESKSMLIEHERSLTDNERMLLENKRIMSQISIVPSPGSTALGAAVNVKHKPDWIRYSTRRYPQFETPVGRNPKVLLVVISQAQLVSGIHIDLPVLE